MNFPSARAARSSATLLVLLLVRTANAFFNDPSSVCAVHERRDRLKIALDGSGTHPAANASYRDLCNPSHAAYKAQGLFLPSQYPGTAANCAAVAGIPTQDSDWPRCVTGVTTTTLPDRPDLGYRYPLRLTGLAPRVFQNTDLNDTANGDWWRVCAKANLNDAGNTIISDPINNRTACPAGTEQVGLCMPSAHYYERVVNGLLKTPGVRFYDFVVTHPDCTANTACANCNDADGCPDVCGHEVASTVNACKALCNRYFRRLRFVVDEGSSDASVLNSNWQVVDDPMTPGEELPPPVIRCPEEVPAPGMFPSGSSHSLADTCIEEQGYCNRPPAPNANPTEPATCGMTPLQICLNNCGPPYTYYDATTPPCTPGGSCSTDESLLRNDTPPWRSKLGVNPPAYDEHNHWNFVSFGRGVTANRNLDNWLRSYSINRDKATAPSAVCGNIIGKYCSTILPRNDSPPRAAEKRQRCKDQMIPGQGDGQTPAVPWKFPLPPLDDFNGPDAGVPGFCDHFFLGNYLCPNTCTMQGSDAGDNPLHRCAGDQNGELGGGSCPEMAVATATAPGAAACCVDVPCTPVPTGSACCPADPLTLTCGPTPACDNISCCEPQCEVP